MKHITNSQWQKMDAGIFIYQITDNSHFAGRFAVRTIVGRSNVNYNDFQTLEEAKRRATEIKAAFTTLDIYGIGIEEAALCETCGGLGMLAPFDPQDEPEPCIDCNDTRFYGVEPECS